MIPQSEIDAAKERLRAAKERLRIPELWNLLGLPGKPGKSCRVPYREDQKASGSVRADGQRFHDFATGDDLDVVEFLARVRGITAGQAIEQFVELANGRQVAVEPPPIIRAPKDKPRAERPDLWRLRNATRSEIERIADSRKIDRRAVELAQDLGTLKVGEVCRSLSWVILDESGICAEGRRLNRKHYPALIIHGDERLRERKAHTLGGSQKSWPMGILAAEEYRKCVEAIALVEGGPDYLAALHFALAQKRTGVLPVALLGRCQGLRGLHPDSLQYLRGTRVRIYPHNDADNGSYKSALIISKQLRQIDCEVDFFVFKGLKKADGAPIKDLNGCVEIAAEQADKLGELFP